MCRIEIDPVKLRHLIEVEQMQQWRVAEIFGVERNLIGKRCQELGLKTQRTGPRSGERHTNWKGGRKKVDRYWYIYLPKHPFATKQGYVLEHRLVMEQELQRFLKPSEVVHHKNGNPEDNRPANLEVFQTNAEHLRHELKGRVPNWTAAGIAKMVENGKRVAIHLAKARDARRRNRSSPQIPSKAGK